MGLCVHAKGLKPEDSFDCGYITFNVFRQNLAATYNQELGRLYEKQEMNEKEIERWNEICNDDLDIFLLHSDCDGKLSPAECRKIYNVIKNLTMDMQGHNYGIMKPYNMLEQWKGILKHCADKRVNLYFA